MDPLRTARTGDLIPSSQLGHRRVRRLDATAVLVPGSQPVDGYLEGLAARREDFAAWDGVVIARDADGEAPHRLLVVDRYGQVYAAHDAEEVGALPDGNALHEWFRFLATACPECGVLDDALLAGPTL